MVDILYIYLRWAERLNWRFHLYDELEFFGFMRCFIFFFSIISMANVEISNPSCNLISHASRIGLHVLIKLGGTLTKTVKYVGSCFSAWPGHPNNCCQLVGTARRPALDTIISKQLLSISRHSTPTHPNTVISKQLLSQLAGTARRPTWTPSSHICNETS